MTNQKHQMITEKLSIGEHNIVFTKKDGTLREMRCTQDMSMVPDEFKPKGNNRKTTESIPVWDIDKKAWRSFRLDSLQKVDEEDVTKIS